MFPRTSEVSISPILLGVEQVYSLAERKLFVGSLGSEHPQDRVQLRLVVLLLNGNRLSQSSNERLIHSFNRVIHRSFHTSWEVSGPYRQGRRLNLLPIGTCRSLRDI